MRAWVRHMRHAQWGTIADAGLSVPMEQPELFNRAVLDFLRLC
jgi:pimeloyl-ACP methyl ester carboxylesterase